MTVLRYATIAGCITLAMHPIWGMDCHCYSGVVSRPQRTGEPQVLREFELIVVQDGQRTFFGVVDDPIEGCPWPESYGKLGVGGGPHPRIVHRHDGRQYSVVLPALRLRLPEQLAIESGWKQDQWTIEVVEELTVDDVGALVLDVSGRRGRKQKLTVDAQSGFLLSAEQDVFMGQGEKFSLTLERRDVRTLPDDESESVARLMLELLSLQTVLDRRADTQQRGLSARQVAAAAERIDHLRALAGDTPLSGLVSAISRDVELQQQRTRRSARRQVELSGTAAPEFLLQLIAGGTLSSKALDDRVVVLHFWDYTEKSLAQPYGQVAYLEFLYSQKKSSGLEVVGIATAPALRRPESLVSAKRSARKVIEFMNLSYPIGYDDGTLLKSFGDAGEAEAVLPLWVVIDADNRIVHYKSGYYEVNRHGLKLLSEAIQAQLKTAETDRTSP